MVYLLNREDLTNSVILVKKRLIESILKVFEPVSDLPTQRHISFLLNSDDGGSCLGEIHSYSKAFIQV